MSNSDLRRAWKAQQATKQDVTNAIPALMGNGHGVVQVPNQPGYVYIRLGQGDLGQAYNNRCPLTDNLAIYVGYDPVLDPDRRIFQVLSVRMADYAGAGGTPTPNVPPHHLTHEYGGGDDVYISWRRLMGFRVGRPSGFQVTVDEGVMIRAGAWLSVAAQTLDLTALKPGGALGCYVLIVLNAAGAATATAGASVGIGTLDISDCPLPGASEFPLAAVRLYGAQTSIGDTPTAPDIIDLRFPQSMSTGDVHLEDLADYARGHIIRGGAADWESYHAANAGFIVQGDGTDVKSLQFDWDTFSAGAGADMVHDHSDDSEGGLLSGGGGGGGGSYTFYLSNTATALWPRSLQPIQDIAWNGANAVSDAIDKLVEYFYAPVDSISYVYAGTASFHLYAGVNVGDPGNTDELANLVVKLYKRLADTSLVLITQATVINYTRYAAYNHIIVTGAIAASYNFAPGDTLVLGLFTSPQTFPSGLTYSTVFELFGYGGVGVTLTGSGWAAGGHVIQDNGSNMPQEMKLNFIGATIADDPANNRTNVTLSSTIDLEDLADYARGSIIRGGAADWEAHNAKTSGFLVQGDGTDVKSAAFDWDTFSSGAGADMVHDHTTSAEGGTLSAINITIGAWVRYASNPVITLGAGGAWDATDVLNPSIIKISDTEYHALYSGYKSPNWQTGHATSTDGKTWTKDAANPVIAKSVGWEALSATNGTTIKFNNTWFHYYCGEDAGNVWKIGLATASSLSGPWTKYVSNPILTAAGGWEGTNLGDVFAFVVDTRIYLFYVGGWPQNIGYAWSDDGYSFTRYGSNPVLAPGAGGTWDDSGVAEPCLLKLGSKWYMWYTGSDGTDRQIGMATSDDLNTWTKSASNPVLSGGAGWDAGDVCDQEVIIEHDQLVMYYGGGTIHNPLSINGQVGRATASITSQGITRLETGYGLLGGPITQGGMIEIDTNVDVGYYEVVMAPGVTPPDPVITPDGTDWVYRRVR